jgi:hypothetical protein
MAETEQERKDREARELADRIKAAQAEANRKAEEQRRKLAEAEAARKAVQEKDNRGGRA